jgi:hypothetical protein
VFNGSLGVSLGDTHHMSTIFAAGLSNHRKQKMFKKNNKPTGRSVISKEILKIVGHLMHSQPR